MKKVSIRILDRTWEKVRTEVLGASTNESVAFLVANHFETTDTIVFLAEDVVVAKSGDYLKRGEFHLAVSPLYISRVLNTAESKGSTVVMTHSHPFEAGKPRYSVTDDLGEARTSETISKCLESNPPVGSLLFGQHDAVGRAWTGLSKERMVADVSVLSERNLQRYCESFQNDLPSRELLDRQLRAIGHRVQENIESLHIGVVGVGGTGSSVAEQLVRMGAQNFLLVDYDSYEPSNWSRMYGSTLGDTATNAPKVEIVASHLSKINPKIKCKAVNKSVMTREVLETLSGCDLIFSCLDRHAPRAVLNELSYQCYVPVFDVGVGLTRDRDGTLGGSIRATIIGPYLPCLFCQEIVRSEMITAEHLSPEEYAARRAEGYVNETDQDAPSVVSFTTMASSLGLMLLLDFLSTTNRNFASTLLFDVSLKQTLKLRSNVKPDCTCQKRLGAGLRIPFSVAD